MRADQAFLDGIRNGDMVLVYDSRDFVNDRDTPARTLTRPATVIARYGTKCDRYGVYPDLLDVVFHHRPFEVSHGHFTERVEPLLPSRDT